VWALVSPLQQHTARMEAATSSPLKTWVPRELYKERREGKESAVYMVS
jgi:hypothetical protein